MLNLSRRDVVPMCYVAIILAVQLFVAINQQATGLALVSSIFGAVYVASLAMRYKGAFLLAIVFNISTLFIGIEHKIFSEMIQQPLFILANIIGFINVAYADREIPAIKRILDALKKFDGWSIIIISLGLTIAWSALSYSLGSPVWYKDGLLGGIALTAQFFTTAGNKNSWFYWMALNLLSSWTWLTVASPNIAMSFLYGLFFVNAIIGYVLYRYVEKHDVKLGKGTF